MKLKKLTLISSTILFLLFTLTLVNLTSANTSKSILYVPIDYPTIQDAINHAVPGDIIFVHEGVYYENIVINKSVTLIGENRDSTIIDGSKNGSVIIVRANNVTIKGFTIRNSGAEIYDCGIFMELSTDNVITGNKLINNYNGIALYTSSRNKISDNIISNNYEGIGFYVSNENSLSNNIISNNYNGVGLYLSSVNNLISGNTFSNNNKGLTIFHSTNNTIYHNNFIDNEENVRADSTNIWDYKGEGNYWSNYLTQDLNRDGIGDYPYVIDANNIDNYPLMGTFFGFNIILKGKTYNIDIVCNSTISDFKFKVGETGSRILYFNVTIKDFSFSFFRVTAPVELMNNPLITLVDGNEVEYTLLNISDVARVCLYFTYGQGNHTVKIISSTVLGLYDVLLNENEKLRSDLSALNTTYQNLLDKYYLLLANYSKLQENYTELNNNYQKHLSEYSKNLQNIQNLVYIMMTSTAIFLATTAYLSKQAHANITREKESLKRE